MLRGSSGSVAPVAGWHRPSPTVTLAGDFCVFCVFCARFARGGGLPPEVSFPAARSIRLRFSPEVTLAIGLTVTAPGVKMQDQSIQLRGKPPATLRRRERLRTVLGDTLAGDTTLFARQDYVEESWRIVDPVLKAGIPIHQYEPNSWGPPTVEQKATPPRG